MRRKLAGDVEHLAAFRHVDVLALDVEDRQRPLRPVVPEQVLDAGLVGSRRRQELRLGRAQVEDVGDRRIGGGGVLAVERQSGKRVPGITHSARHRREGFCEGVAVRAAQIAVDIEGGARQFDGLEPDAADQRHGRRQLETVLERQRDIVDMREEVLGLLEAIEAAIGIDQADGIIGEGVVLHGIELQAACGEGGHEAVVHSGKIRVHGEVADIAPELLVVIDRQALAIDLALRAGGRRRAVVERIDLVVEPVPLRRIGVDLAPELDAVGDVPLHAAA